MSDKETECQECGMIVGNKEYHPFGACLMFRGCKDSRKVRSNLTAIVAHAQDSAKVNIRTNILDEVKEAIENRKHNQPHNERAEQQDYGMTLAINTIDNLRGVSDE